MSESGRSSRIWDIAREHGAQECADQPNHHLIAEEMYAPATPGHQHLKRGWTIPRPSAQQRPLSWIHVPATGGLHMIVLSTEPHAYTSHWVDGRMRPCTGPGCLYHNVRIGSQERYILSVFVPDLANSALIELGYKPIEQLRFMLPRTGNARGIAIYAYHANDNPRGKIIITPSDCERAAKEKLPKDEHGKPILPPEIDPSEILAATWERAGRAYQ